MLSCWIVLLALTAGVAPRKEVAVVLGGRNNSLVEIFTDREDSCVTDQDLEIWSSLFKYSGAEQHAAGVYVDNDGIYVCGGGTGLTGPSPTYHTSCEYNHSPFTSSWAKINYTDESQVGVLGGIFDSALVPWQDHGFIQVGGSHPDLLVGYDNTYLHAGDDVNPKISEDLDKALDRARAGHCFVRVRSQCGDSCSGDLYIVIGGKEYSNTNNIQSFISYVHCQDLACQQFDWREAAVEDLAPLNLTNRDRHSCTVVRENNQDLVLIVDRNVTYILDHQCLQYNCTFSLRTLQNMTVWQESSKTTTLDGVPFLFTERLVYKYLNHSWVPAGELKYERAGPSIVSVPEDWLCTGYFNTTTTTTTPSTTTVASTDPSCPTEGTCRAEDGRGESWEAEYWSTAERPCGGSMTGRAVWFCDGCEGTFSGPQPDRVECVETWVGDLDLQIEDPQVTSTQISANIVKNTNNQTGPGLTGGSILSLLGHYGRILDKRQAEDGQEVGAEFAKNMLAATSDVIQLQVGWNEIPDENLRFQTSSSVLSFIDVLGYQHVKEKHSRSSQCWVEEEVFTSENIILNLRSGDRGDASLCFDFAAAGGEGTQGRICIPESTVQDDCPTYVSSHFAFDNEKSSLFPTPAGSDLESNLIGLTVNNGSLNIDSQSDRIEITFFHAGHQVGVGVVWITGLAVFEALIFQGGEVAQCVWWDPVTLDWSGQGCEVSSEGGTDLATTICHCHHLTSFGIMFSGEAQAQDPVLSVLSDVLLVVSSLCVLATQALLFFVIK